MDEIRELTVLAKDAAGIMWEMVAMNETGSAATEMRANATQLQVGARRWTEAALALPYYYVMACQ